MNANTKTLPAALTSYDLLKSFAILTMIIDHIGFHFYPDSMWWRAVGRMSGPVWLFLVGYALSRDFTPRLWIGAAVLIVASGLLGPTVLPVNILVTILGIRFILDQVADRVLPDHLKFIQFSVLVLLISIPTIMIVDYGALALSIALYGAAMRRYADGQAVFKDAPIITGVIAFVFYCVLMIVIFGFSTPQSQAVLVGCGVVFLGLYFFKPAQYPSFTAKAPKIVVALLQFCGRRTLEIYIVHLLIFKALAVYLGVEGFGLLDWGWLN
jgi:hypothetical protein